MGQYRFRSRSLLCAGVLAALLVPVSAYVAAARGGSQATRAGDASDNGPDCASLTQMRLENAVIVSATLVPASAEVPEYCKVLGTLEQPTRFEVALPSTTWNGKFFFAGGGGNNGTVPVLTHALARGYAAAGSDTGHQGTSMDATWAWGNEQARINYAYRATHLVTVLAKEVVRGYYGQKERRAYWLGCSNGGKMALMEVQRYPNDYDGVIAGASFTDRNNLNIAFLWNQVALAAAPIPPNKIPLIDRATLAACDARDGLVDGLIDRPDQCRFDPGVLRCSGADSPDCLTPAQVTALEKIYAGPTSSSGKRWYPGLPPGHEEDYPAFVTGDGTRAGAPSSSFRFADGYWRSYVFGPSFQPLTDFDFDRTPADPRFKAIADEQDVPRAFNPDLGPFKAHGGKLVMYHGWADHSITALRAIQYYQDLRNSISNPDESVRLFVVPGLHHCRGGPGPINFGGSSQRWLKDDADHDIVRALDRWVEQGAAPQRLVGVKFVEDDPKQGVARSRPICPYPQVATWIGSGSLDDAANFVCANPR